MSKCHNQNKTRKYLSRGYVILKLFFQKKMFFENLKQNKYFSFSFKYISYKTNFILSEKLQFKNNKNI